MSRFAAKVTGLINKGFRVYKVDVRVTEHYRKYMRNNYNLDISYDPELKVVLVRTCPAYQ